MTSTTTVSGTWRSMNMVSNSERDLAATHDDEGGGRTRYRDAGGGGGFGSQSEFPLSFSQVAQGRSRTTSAAPPLGRWTQRSRRRKGRRERTMMVARGLGSWAAIGDQRGWMEE